MSATDSGVNGCYICARAATIKFPSGMKLCALCIRLYKVEVIPCPTF